MDFYTVKYIHNMVITTSIVSFQELIFLCLSTNSFNYLCMKKNLEEAPLFSTFVQC